MFAGAHTSCPFAENVEKTYLASPGSQVTAISPVTGQSYVLQCNGDSPYVCTGGTGAYVAFYG